MDSQEKDESRDRLREEALTRRMGEALARISANGTEECPDAGLIAAYYERSLQPEELAEWEGHFAGCPQCRKILAMLAASIDAPLAETEVARLDELVAVSAQSAGGDSLRPAKVIASKRLDWRARWLAPALGVAAVLAVWFAERPPWRAVEQGPSGTLVAQAPGSETPTGQDHARALDQFSGMESKKAPEAARVIPQNWQPESKVNAGPGPESPETSIAADKQSSNFPKAKAATPRVAPENRKESPAPLAAANAASAPAAVPAPAAPAPQMQASNGETSPPPLNGRAMANSSARDALSTREGVRADAVSVPRPTADTPLNGRSMQALSLAKNSKTAGEQQIPAPSGKVAWRAGLAGKIERSLDDRQSWVVQASPSSQDWLAGAAASDTVCWLAGRSGAIARTTDGEHWFAIAPPPSVAGPSGRLPDWTGITASSELAATVTSSDGRRYATLDGGLTWRQQ
jgi:hypothetical protein